MTERSFVSHATRDFDASSVTSEATAVDDVDVALVVADVTSEATAVDDVDVALVVADVTGEATAVALTKVSRNEKSPMTMDIGRANTNPTKESQVNPK